MDDKEFRKLRREDLIEIIYQYQRRDQKLTQENEMLRRQLEDRQIRLQKAGSIAEASMALSGVFEAAQKAADLYLQSVKEYSASAPRQPQTVAEKVPAEKHEIKAPAEKSVIPASPEKTNQNSKKKKSAEGMQEKKTETSVPKKELPKKPSASEPVHEEKKPSAKPEIKMPAEEKIPSSSQNKTAAGQPAVPGKTPKPENTGKDTDEFIASLKEYLGM